MFNSFFTDEILELLSRYFCIQVYAAPNVSPPLDISKKLRKIGISLAALESSKTAQKIQLLALDFETLCEHKKVRSFETRVRHRFNIPAEVQIKVSSLFSTNRFRQMFIALAYVKLFRWFTRPCFRKIAEWDFHVLRRVKSDLDMSPKNQTKILMLSGGAFGGIENIIVKICREKEIKSYLVVDNWDNLSSKSIYWNLPDFVGVWGEKMKQDAIEIQNFQPSQVHIIGSSRIFSNVRQYYGIRYPKTPYVTFFGSGWQFSDELNLVKVAAKCLSEIVPELTLIYRPHPAQLHGDAIEKIKGETFVFQNIDIDSEFMFNYDRRDWYNSDSLMQMQRLILGSKFVIGAHSTSLVEALYFGKAVIAYSETKNPFFRNGDAWEGYSHMLQIRGNKGVFEAKSELEFIDKVKSLAIKCKSQAVKNNLDRENQENLVPEILPNFESRYADRLINFINMD